jgi:hypothetical protein
MQTQTVVSPDVPAIYTPWTHADESEARDQLDALRDQLFRQRALQVMNENAPYLAPLLRAANAVISVQPGRFDVVIPGGEVVPIPWLGAFLILLPWAEACETAH